MKERAGYMDTRQVGGTAPKRAGTVPRLVVLHQDESLVVIDKPPGLLARRGTNREPGATDLLTAPGAALEGETLFVVHRIDRDTSGVMVLARTPDAHRFLNEAFRNRRVLKVYWALVRGRLEGEGQIDLPIGVEPSGTRSRVVPSGGRTAHTSYRAVEHVAGHTLVECRPTTGRLHQIRVHLAAIGHPLAVDPLYGGSDAILLSTYKSGYRTSRRHEERPLIGRLTLHAARLEFDHPLGTGTVAFTAELPRDFRATLAQLRKIAGTPTT